MDEVVVAEEAGASSSTAGADSDDSLPQPPTIPLVESIDEGLVPDIIAGTTGTSSVFQSAWVDLLIRHTLYKLLTLLIEIYTFYLFYSFHVQMTVSASLPTGRDCLCQ